MKSVFIILFIALTNLIQGQTIPEFDSNISDNEIRNSLILTHFQNNYEIIISYTVDCIGSENQRFFILGYKNKHWDSFQWSIKFKDITKTIKNIKRIEKKKLKLKDEDINSLLVFWTQNDFWNLDNDSLNIRIKYEKVNDSITAESIYRLTDGCSYKFEIVNGNQYKLYNSYEPEHFQSAIPMRQLEIFILCRNEFVKLLIKNK